MKYTIELTENQKKQMDLLCELAHRYIGFNPKLEPIKATNVEDTKEYQIGYKTGYDIAQTNAQATKEEWGEAEYNKALNDVNHALTVLENMTETEREEWFEDYASVGEVVRECTVQRIIESTKEYEEKKKAEEESIQVGDVVKFNEKCHNYDHVKSRAYLVLHIFDNGLVTLLYDNGDTGAAAISLLDKTGKHVGEVEQLLSKLQAN